MNYDFCVPGFEVGVERHDPRRLGPNDSDSFDEYPVGSPVQTQWIIRQTKVRRPPSPGRGCEKVRVSENLH